MTLAGWIFMLTSMGVVIGILLFCFIRLMSAPSSAEHMHAPLDIDTHDKGT